MLQHINVTEKITSLSSTHTIFFWPATSLANVSAMVVKPTYAQQLPHGAIVFCQRHQDKNGAKKMLCSTTVTKVRM